MSAPVAHPSIESLALPLPTPPPPATRSAVVVAPGPGPSGESTSVAGPSTAGTVALVLLLVVAVVGVAGTVRRRLDPRCRAEATFFDRAGVSAADRRRLRVAARRLEPPVPAASLLLSPGLLDLAVHRSGAAPADVAALTQLARRRFGRVADDGEAMPPLPPPPGAVAAAAPPPAPRPAATITDTAPHRSRAVSLLAVAMAAAEERREQAPVTGPR